MFRMATVEIAPKVFLPLFGFGTFRLTGADVQPALDSALGAGYRLIDTASAYGNEQEIGDALKFLLPKHNLARKDIFITTKLSRMGVDGTEESLQRSLKQLQTDYVDLYLVHYPKGRWDSSTDRDEHNPEIRRKVWLEMEQVHSKGLTRAIGVSNYEISHLEPMQSYATIKPAVNQCEYHPHFQRKPLVDYCRTHNIHWQAFTSLGRNDPDLFGEPVLKKIAAAHNSTVGQILLAWPIAKGISVIPKSATAARIVENFGASKIKLSAEEVKEIDTLDRGKHYTKCEGWNVL